MELASQPEQKGKINVQKKNQDSQATENGKVNES
jgi:hypothetical protein